MAGFSPDRGACTGWTDSPVYEAYAVRYATLLGYDVASLVQGADPKRKLDLAMVFWVLKAPSGRIVLVDAGFYRPRDPEAEGRRRLHAARQGTRKAGN